MLYKVGDKVLVIKKRNAYRYHMIDEKTGNRIDIADSFVEDMCRFLWKTVTIASANIKYRIREDCGFCSWTDEMFEGLVTDAEEIPEPKAEAKNKFDFELENLF